MVRADAEGAGEHGPGAVRSSARVRPERERPLQRGGVMAPREALFREERVKQGGNAAIVALDQTVGGVFLLYFCRKKKTK